MRSEGAEPWLWAAEGPVCAGGLKERGQQCFWPGSVPCGNCAPSGSSGHLEGTSSEALVPQSALGFHISWCERGLPDVLVQNIPGEISCSDLVWPVLPAGQSRGSGLRRAGLGFDLCKPLPVTPVTLPTVTKLMMKPLLKVFQ